MAEEPILHEGIDPSDELVRFTWISTWDGGDVISINRTVHDSVHLTAKHLYPFGLRVDWETRMTLANANWTAIHSILGDADIKNAGYTVDEGVVVFDGDSFIVELVEDGLYHSVLRNDHSRYPNIELAGECLLWLVDPSHIAISGRHDLASHCGPVGDLAECTPAPAPELSTCP